MPDSAKDEIIASLEGMKIVATSASCELHEYNFAENAWHQLETSARPMEQERAEGWLSGWNPVDRFAALTLLTAVESG
jgi:hypothetical protein